MNPLFYNITTFFLLTAGCFGLVEGGYYVLERQVFQISSVKSEDIGRRQTVSGGAVVMPVEKEDVRDDVAAIVERALFDPLPGSEMGRVEVKQPSQPLTETTLDIVLMGTIEGPGKSSRAIILNKKDRKQDLFQTGDYIQDALVKRIERGKVILVVNGEEQVLDMSESHKYIPKQPVNPMSVAPTPRKTKALVLERTAREQKVIKQRLLQRENMMRSQAAEQQTPP